jgi:hypothetical protein
VNPWQHQTRRIRTMHESLTIEPVSSTNPEFRRFVLQALAEGKSVVLLFRYPNAAGAKGYFIVRSSTEFDATMNRAPYRTSITAFLEDNFKLRGIANDDLCNQAIDLLATVFAEYEGVDIIRTDGTESELDDEHYAFVATPEEIHEWFRTHKGVSVLVGTMIFWHANCPEIVTVYAPDDDGVVRLAAY